MKRNIAKLIIEELRFDTKQNVNEIKVLRKNMVEIIYKPGYVIQVSFQKDTTAKREYCLIAIWRDMEDYCECYPAIFHKSFDTIDDLKYFLQTKENYLQQLSNLYQKEKLLMKEIGE